MLPLVLSISLGFGQVYAQTGADFGIPDSAYIPNQLIVWFSDGTLNPEYLGGYGEMVDYPFSNDGMGVLPVTLDFIQSQSLVLYLQERGVQSMYKVVPWIDPYRDTLSITRAGDTVRIQPWWNALILEFDPGMEANMVYEAYMLLALHFGSVRWAQPNFTYVTGHSPLANDECEENTFRKAAQINDPRWADQISVHDVPSGIYIEAAWAYNQSDPLVRIAVIDDGINPNNPDFSGKLGLDPQGSGKKKYIPNGAGTGDHGTDMAGIIGARANNNIGIAGIAGGSDVWNPGSRLYILDVADRNRTIITSTAANALIEASLLTTSGKGFACRVANLSLYHYTIDPFLREAVVTAYAHGLRVNACMGNKVNNTPQYPAATDDHYILAVGAKYHDFSRHPSCGYGEHMDIMAPGYGSIDLDPQVPTPHIFTTKGSIFGYSGGLTSAATAHITGVSALVITEYLNSGWAVDKPYYPEDIENLLEAGCVDGNGQVRGTHDDQTGWGYLQAANSLSYLNAPYVLRHYSGSLDLEALPASTVIPGNVPFVDIHQSNALITLRNPEQYKITTYLTYPAAFQSVVRTWVIGNIRSGHEWLSAARHWPHTSHPYTEVTYQLGFSEVESFDSHSCEISTYFYYGPDAWTGAYTWVPFNPMSKGIQFNYTVLGIPGIVGLDENSESNPSELSIISAYPNPVRHSHSDRLNVVFDGTAEVNRLSVTLTDIFGRRVAEQYLSDQAPNLNNIVVPTSHLPSGAYLLTLRGGSSIATRVVTILH